jgi:hypothetical protein
LNMAMKIQVHSRNFCASWVPSSFQRMTATSSQYLYLINTEAMPGLYLMYRQYRQTYLSYEAQVWTFLLYTERSTEHESSTERSYPTSYVSEQKLVFAYVAVSETERNYTRCFLKCLSNPSAYWVTIHTPYSLACVLLIGSLHTSTCLRLSHM